jgi:hypothetical protein
MDVLPTGTDDGFPSMNSMLKSMIPKKSVIILLILILAVLFTTAFLGGLVARFI